MSMNGVFVLVKNSDRSLVDFPIASASIGLCNLMVAFRQVNLGEWFLLVDFVNS